MESDWTKNAFINHFFYSKRQDYDLGIQFSSLDFENGGSVDQAGLKPEGSSGLLVSVSHGVGVTLPLS